MPTPTRAAGRIARSIRPGVLVLGVLLMAARPAVAADVVVLTSGALKPALLSLAASFQARTGDTLAVSNDTTRGITARIVRDEEIDLVILPAAALDALAALGKVAVDSVVPVAKSGIGIVVKRGSPAPDISTVEAFKQTMLAVPSFAMIDPASGDVDAIWLAKLFDKLGIAEPIRRKAVLVPGGLTASRVDDGEAVLALQQITELRAVSDVTFVGPLPDAIQQYTVYAVGIPIAARRHAAAKALSEYLRSEAAAEALTTRGLEHP